MSGLATVGSSGSLRIGDDGTIQVSRIAVNDNYTYREIHYIYGTPEGVEEENRAENRKPKALN